MKRIKRSLAHTRASPSKKPSSEKRPSAPLNVEAKRLRADESVILAHISQSIQRDRVGFEATLRDHPKLGGDVTFFIRDQLKSLEAFVRFNLTAAVRAFMPPSVIEWAYRTIAPKGEESRLADMIFGLVDIRRANTISQLWRYAGYAVMSNPDTGELEGERRRRGEKLHYNSLLHKTCFLVARQFLMHRIEPYRGIYLEAKAHFASRHPDWPLWRQDIGARRKMIKLFLSHLWVKWREAEGLPVTLPYPQAVLGHPREGYIPPPMEE